MPISQNLRFTATIPVDKEFDHPPGAAIIRRLSTDLAAAGWQCDEFDNWRDCGWSVMCRKGSAELGVVVSQVPDDAWMLQVSPCRAPGFIGRLFGRQASATAGEVHELALAVHRALAAAGFLGNPRWRWDGFPDERHATPEPHPA